MKTFSLLLLWAAIAIPAFAQNQGGGITQPGAAQRSLVNPTTLSCTVGQSPSLLYNNGGTDSVYTAQGSPCAYALAPGGSTTVCGGAVGGTCGALVINGGAIGLVKAGTGGTSTTPAVPNTDYLPPANPALTGTPTLNGTALGPYVTTPNASGDFTLNASTGVGAVSKVGGVAPGGLFSQTAPSQSEPLASPGGTVAPYSYLNPNVSTPITQSQTQINAKIIRVSDFGVYNDNVDHTALMNQLMANAPAGSLIQFPCSTNGNYRFSGQLNFAGNHVYRGDITRASTGCPIISAYGGGAGSGAAFNFIGVGTVRFEHMHFWSFNSGNPPEAIAIFADSQTVGGDNISGLDVTFNGFATRVGVYSISAEGQRWYTLDVELSGGGALYPIYISSSDTLGICPTCETSSSSNTDIRFYGLQIADTTPSAGAGHCGLVIAGDGNTKDISIEGGYVAMPGDISGTANGAGFCLPSVIGGNISIKNIRVEGAAYFALATANISGLHLESDTLASITGQINFLNAAAGTTMSALYELGNNSTAVGSSIATLTNSFVLEPFQVTVTAPFNSIVNNLASTTFQMSALLQLDTNGISQPTCDAAHKGTFYSGQGVLPTTLIFCGQDQAGAYAWRPLIATLVNTVAPSATPAFNLALGTYQTNTLTANITSFTVTGITAGGHWCFDFPQNATGGFTVSGAPATVHGFFTIPGSEAASKHNVQCFSAFGSTTDIYADSAGQTNQ